jgi:hypothetical protein
MPAILVAYWQKNDLFGFKVFINPGGHIAAIKDWNQKAK